MAEKIGVPVEESHPMGTSRSADVLRFLVANQLAAERLGELCDDINDEASARSSGIDESQQPRSTRAV